MKPNSRNPLFRVLTTALCLSAPVSALAAPLYQWNFDGASGVPAISSGGGTLTANGTASFADTGVSGLPGDNALSVTNAYTGGVGAGNSASNGAPEIMTGIGTLTNFTVTMWVKLTPGDLTNFPRLFQLGATATPDSGSNPGVNLLVNNGNLEIGVNGRTAPIAAGLSAGVWKFIAFSYDGAATNPYFSPTNNGLYAVNNNGVVLTGSTTGSVSVVGSNGLNTGAPSFTTSPGPAAIGATGTLYLGNRADGGRGFSGSIDDVRIHNTQLTISELNAIRLESAPPLPPGGTPVYWKGGVNTSWTAANWTSDPSGTTAVPLPVDGSAAATFAATGATNMTTTLLAADQNVKSLQFNTESTAVGIGGTHNLTIEDAGITLDADAGTVQLNTTGQVILGANQFWTNNAATPFTVSSGISGAFTLISGGTGETLLSGANTHAGTTVSAGTLKIGNALALGAGSTPFNAEGGTLDLNGFNPQVGSLTGTTLGTIANRREGTTATLGVNTPEFTTDIFAGHLNDGSPTQILALSKTGGGTLTLSSTSTFTGNILVSEGILRATTALFGAPNASNLGNAQVGGRTVTVSSGAAVQFNINNVLGNQFGNFSLLPAFVLNGGTLNATRYNVLGAVTLNGGTLSTSEAGGPAYFGYQFKGDIIADGATTSLISTASGKGNHLDADTRFEVTTASVLEISTPLLNQSNDFSAAAGGLSKDGPGILVLSGANTYTGATYLLQGVLSLATSSSLSNTAELSVPDTTLAALELNFLGTEIVGDFLINGVSPGTGTYGPMDSDADFKYPWITGSGLISVPNPDPYLDWIETYYPAPDPNGGKAEDPDNDGLTNLQEFAFNSLPNDGTSSGKTRSGIQTVGDGQALVITFPVRLNAQFIGTTPAEATVTADRITYSVAGSNSLMTFDQPVSEVSISTVDFPTLDVGWEYRTFRLDGNVGGLTPRGPLGFLRAGVVEAP